MGANPPVISVLMSVYNYAEYLPTSIQSILDQTFSDFEFIIVNDGSTDSSPDILKGYASRDKRIVLLSNQVNQGLPTSLNNGLAKARGRYIARHDGDDISLPERFQRQFDFLESHPEVGVLGTHRRLIDSEGKSLGDLPSPLHHNAIAWNVFWGLSFGHPTVLCRRELMQSVGGYRAEDTAWAEDLDLWLRLLSRTRFANLDEYLVDYRMHSGSVSHSKRMMQLQTAAALKNNYVHSELGLEPPEGIFEKLKRTSVILPDIDVEYFEPYMQFLQDLAKNMEAKGIIDSNSKPGVTELITIVAFHLALHLEPANEKQFLKMNEDYLPRWLYRFVRKYFRISSRARGLLPGKPPKTFHWPGFAPHSDKKL